MAYHSMYITDGWMPANESMPLSRAAAEEALRLDPSLAEAHTFLGNVHHGYDRDYEAARREFQTALAMQPDLPSAHLSATIARNGDYGYARLWLGRAYARVGRLPEAIAELNDIVKSEPIPEYESALGRVYADAGNTKEATRVLNYLRERMRDE